MFTKMTIYPSIDRPQAIGLVRFRVISRNCKLEARV